VTTDIRERISHRPTRAHVELQVRRAMAPLALYLAGLMVAGACAVYIALHLPGKGGLASTRTYAFAVRDATGIVPGRDEVRFKGIPAGTITASRLQNGRAILTISLESKFGTIYRDAQAALRPNTPLQDMYLDVLTRGTLAAGAASTGDPLPESQTTSSVNISDVLQVFDADTRANLATTLSQFGQGLRDRGAQLRTAFVDLVPLLQAAGRLSQQLTLRSTETRQLAHDTALLTGELARRQLALRTLVSEGGKALDTLQASAPSLGATLAQLPPTLADVGSSFTALQGALPDVDSALANLGPVARELPSALAAVRRLSDQARPAVQALEPSIRSLGPLAAILPPLSGNLASSATRLLPQVGDYDHLTRDLASCTFVLQRFFQWTQSTFAMGDAHGEAPRGDAAFGIDTPGIVSDPRVSIAPTCSGAHVEGGAPTPFVQP
jgi:ABC-type transporter Mla subunit MlaD